MVNGGQEGVKQSEHLKLFELPELELMSPPAVTDHASPKQLPELELTEPTVGAHSKPTVGASALVPPPVQEGENLAETLYELAGAQAKSGNYKKAQRLLSHALIIVEDQLGTEHLATAQILANLGTVHLLQNNYEYAERFLHRAILVLDLHPGTEVEIARAFNNLSAVYNRLGEYADGEKCLREALDIMERTLVEELGHTDHPELIPILQNYAELLVNTNRRPEAAQLKARIESITRVHAASQAA